MKKFRVSFLSGQYLWFHIFRTRSRSRSIEEIVRRDKVSSRSIRDRLGSREIIDGGGGTDDERHVKTTGVNIQVGTLTCFCCCYWCCCNCCWEVLGCGGGTTDYEKHVKTTGVNIQVVTLICCWWYCRWFYYCCGYCRCCNCCWKVLGGGGGTTDYERHVKTTGVNIQVGALTCSCCCY